VLADYHEDVKGEIVPTHVINIYRVSGGIVPLIRNLGTRWK
jgi:hypothetical protein